MSETFHSYEQALLNPLDVKTLIFSFNNSSHIEVENFLDERIKALINLEELSIEGFEGTQLSLPAEISQLKNLKELSIFARNLIEIPTIIWEMKSLNYLFLEINSIQNGSLQLSKLDQLKSVGFKIHNTEILTSDVFDNVNVTRFYLKSDDLKEIPNHFDKLMNLNNLTLHCENLIKFPDTISNLCNLKTIDVYNKSIKSININFNLLENIEEFRWGQISFFPTGINKAKSLKRLNLDVSSFETIDADEAAFQSLEKLELSFCKLKKIPKCFETLDSIKTLDLGYSNFSELDFDFKNLKNLSFLCFKRCENFENIDITKFIKSISTITNLRYLETPRLTAQQIKVRNKSRFDFEWIED